MTIVMNVRVSVSTCVYLFVDLLFYSRIKSWLSAIVSAIIITTKLFRKCCINLNISIILETLARVHVAMFLKSNFYHETKTIASIKHLICEGCTQIRIVWITALPALGCVYKYSPKYWTFLSISLNYLCLN